MLPSQENPGQQLPYKENKESFGRWFRETAKDKWETYLNGDDKNISITERDAMRGFLLEHGTQEEIQKKLGSYGYGTLPFIALVEEVKSKRPDIKIDLE